MDERWDADVEIEGTPGGAFVAVLVLTPPPEIGPTVRWVVPGGECLLGQVRAA